MAGAGNPKFAWIVASPPEMVTVVVALVASLKVAVPGPPVVLFGPPGWVQFIKKYDPFGVALIFLGVSALTVTAPDGSV
jgi:hypothetical protein